MAKRKKKEKADRRAAAAPIAVQQQVRRKSRILLVVIGAGVLVAGALLFVTSYLKPSQVVFGAFRDHNVLLVTIDTLRADHLPV